MTGTRLSVGCSGGDAAAAVALAEEAERWNLDQVWLGPVGASGSVDDSYVLTVAAAVAAVTTDVRLGVVLDLSGTATPLHVAEDLAVVDHASAGRLEVALRPTPDDGWLGRATAVLTAWEGWPLPRGGAGFLGPHPSQPWLPRLVAGPYRPEQAGVLGAGSLVPEVDVDGDAPTAPLRRTVVTTAAPPTAVVVGEPLLVVRRLRELARRASAQEVLLVIDDGDVGAAGLRHLGTVIAAGLRSGPEEVDSLVLDAVAWASRTAG